MPFFTTVFLMLFLSVASWQDYNNYKIQNKLIISGTFFGIALNIFLPNGIGAPDALIGCGFGLLLLLPFYIFRVMGAGDVKLMAMVGAFIGSTSILFVFCYTLIAGGVLAFIISLHRGKLRKMLNNMANILIHPGFSGQFRFLQAHTLTSVESAGKIPYAIAITLGTTIFLIINQDTIFI